jgi:hypothetical protein
MTLDECHQNLVDIRRKQGTRNPRVRIDCGGTVYRGRISRADSDPEHRSRPLAPTGALVLEDLKLGRQSTTIISIDQIQAGSICPLDQSA